MKEISEFLAVLENGVLWVLGPVLPSCGIFCSSEKERNAGKT
jgi:hypothetical protein